MRGYINNRMPLFLQLRLDSQIANGNGTAPNLRGLLNVVGVQTQAAGADTTSGRDLQGADEDPGDGPGDPGCGDRAPDVPDNLHRNCVSRIGHP